MSKRVLLLYISNVSGHRQASIAIEEALKLLNPSIEIKDLNCVNYTSPVLEKVVNSTYMGIVKRTPELWEYLYDNPNIVKKTRRIRDFINKHESKKLRKLIDGFRPDVVACTQAFPCGLVANYKKMHNTDLSLVGVLTDYAPHSYWIYDNVDAYVVPCESTGQRLRDNGVDESRIYPYGIPIRPHFLSREDKVFVCGQNGLSPDLPTVLVMGGGQGLGPIDRLVTEFFKVKMPLQLIVVTGTNAKLYKRLKKRQSDASKPLILFRFTESIHQLMDITDVIISKPGGVTSAECLSKNIPMIIINPLPGQETMNANYLVSEKVALRADTVPQAVTNTIDILKDPETLWAMKEKARAISKPDAALNTARLIQKLTVKR